MRGLFLAAAGVVAEDPLGKVVGLLQGMKSQLSEEGEQDQKMYNKFTCWCNTNRDGKTEAIATAQTRITELTTTVEEAAASSARLETEIKQLQKEITKNKNGLKTARALREKTSAEAYDDEKDTVQSIAALKNAIQVLSKHHSEGALTAVTNVMKKIMAKKGEVMGDMAEHKRRRLTTFLQKPAGYESYSSQSSEIFGILNDMLETFEADLESARKEEATSKENYEGMKAAKEEEISAAKDNVANKKTELADSNERLSNAKEDLDDMENALSSDTAFLSDLNLKCKDADEQFAQRQFGRNQEIEAVGKAIQILTEDSARELTHRSMSFLQVGAVKARARSSNARVRAAQALLQTAVRTGNGMMEALAAQVQLDDFAKVKKAIDDMVVQLKKESAEEVKKNDYCDKEFNQNEKEHAIKDREHKDHQSTITDLEATIAQLEDGIASDRAEIASTRLSLKQAGEAREEENAAYQKNVRDQRATQALIRKAMEVLEGVYGKSSLLQRQEPGAAVAPPPPSFQSGGQNKGNVGVLSLMESLVEDSQKVEEEAIQGEQQAEESYETFLRDSNAAVAALQKEISDAQADVAKTKQELAQENLDDSNVLAEIERLETYRGDLHVDCDFLVKNFDVRQQAREDNINALVDAKSMLSGANLD
mmetsp:Transcript_11187/g.26659  ORF Transcript_11187/g.26659 Transcript_11187/m.26659 type:complete len:652 (-) Transcript_11187:32-1987(-)